jgi:LacI family transcriptional regulator
MRRNNAPTLQDVADRAGVSVMMASVVLNGAQSSTRVAPATRERIKEIAAGLNYRRNEVARGLSRQSMNTIGVAAVVDGGEINFYFLEVLNGILEGAAAHGQNTTIFSLKDWTTDSARLPKFCDGRVDGMILIAPNIRVPETVARHTPFVILHGNEQEPNAYNLDIDNEGGAYAVTRHLIEAGHRDIALMPGGREVVGVRKRIEGSRRAFAESGLELQDSDIIEGNFSAWSGKQRTTQLLERQGERALPTAIICGSDAIAYGCMEVLAAHRIRVPEDISVTGFDDTLLARMTSPPLTTVRQPFREMGRCSVDKLLGQIVEGPCRKESTTETGDLGHNTGCAPRIQLFPAELVIRESVGPPRA